MAMFRTKTSHTLPDGRTGLTVLHFWGESSSEAAEQASNKTYTFWNATKGWRHPACTSQVLPEVERIDPINGMIDGIFPASQSPVVGTATGEALPAASQGLLAFATATIVNGRRVRGHIFLPAPTEAFSQGRPLEAYMDGYDAAAPDLLDEADLVRLTVWHRPTATLPGGSADVTNAVTRGYWAVLRSRRVSTV